MRKILTALLLAPLAAQAQVAHIAEVEVPEDTPTGIDISVEAAPSYYSWEYLGV